MKEHRLLFLFAVWENVDRTCELGKGVSGLQKDALQGANRYLARNRHHRIWKKVVRVLACVVMFCTTYMLILPAITMGNTTYCGYEMHQHSPECYEKMSEWDESVLTCGLEEHTHELSCYSNPEADVESPEIWQQSVSGVELTGNRRTDLVAVAESQLDYAESSQNYAVDENETKKGYTRYGAWYGDEFAYEDWNSLFVMFCLDYAEIPIGAMSRSMDCQEWIETLNEGYYGADSGYEPVAGDLVFFDTDKDGMADRVGIVTKASKEQSEADLTGIETIQGDVEDKVQSVYYKVNENEAIIGYAALTESFGEENKAVEPENDGQNTEFIPDSGSGVMSAALNLSDLNGKTFALFNLTHQRAVMATSAKMSGKLDAAEAGYFFDNNGVVHIYPTTTEGQESPDYVLWTFERVEASADTCYITTTVDGQRKYLTINGENVTVEDYIENETDRAAKQVITVTEGTGNLAGQVRFTNAAGYAVNKYYGKEYFGGWKGVEGNTDEYFYLAKHGDPNQIGTVEGVTPNGTVINVFDYWVTQRNSPEGDHYEGDKWFKGINSGHTLKFTKNGVGDVKQTNHWTKGKEPLTGLVENKLGTDGYPFLTHFAAENSGNEIDKKQESLAYLFNPTAENEYRQTFRNVGGLLQIDEAGYYYYDSQKNFAQLDEDTRQFTLYNTWGVKAGASSPDGQFFPFNTFVESKNNNSTSKEINHYFGMTMTSRFVQRYGGHTNASKHTATIFDFSGDDDVWIFIDGVLVGDLGGIHDRASLKIDFSTGEVFINDNKTTTLKEAFETAGVVTTDDEWNKNTFADNTYHTLKFYYLERGNYDSNMSLKYNLTAVPATSIYKTDQYGQHLPGVEFEVYQADENWNIKNGTPVYTDKTDVNGKLTFVDEDQMPYTLKELKEKFGEYCILKETKAPPGYRLVDTEVRLRISNTALWCENTYESGVWATVTQLVSAPPELLLVNSEEPQPFYDDVGVHGTLFGVVAKRVGTGEISKQESWVLVSGDSESGYRVHEADSNEEFIQAAIDIAKEKNSVFSMAPSGAMELLMEDLPGHVTEYYYMLPDAEKENAKFTTSYYWTTGSLEEATVDNTFRVNSDAEAPNAFDRTFGAIIEVPNLCNRLLVQKFDENGKLINGATFALFKADEDGSYIAADGSKVTLEEGKYTTEVNFNADDDSQNYAVIKTDSGKIIRSVEQRQTNNVVLHGTDGTCVFGIRETVLDEGCYYLREVEAPPGYKINPTPVMVRVTEKAIYANAGKANDGVQVARGPGYISSTLHKAASVGDVDNTLTWIYQKLKVSSESNSFADLAPDSGVTWEYAKNAAGLELASYLIYTRTAQHLGVNRFLANYEVDEKETRPAMEGTVRTHVQQIATDVGWSYNEIYQDYDYGIEKVKENGKNANYTDLREKGDISNLFSRSVYVQVTDEKVSNLEISKTVTGIDSNASDVEFAFAVTVEGATDEYEYAIYSSSDSERKTPVGTGKISSGDTIKLKDGQVAVIKDLPLDAKYTVTETPDDGYNPSYSIDGADSVTGNTAEGTLTWKEGAQDGAHISRVDFTNTSPLDLTLIKYAAGTTTPLSGAQFVLHTTGEPIKYYKIESGEVSWVSLDAQNTLQNLALTTDTDGRIEFSKLPDGGYSLKEIVPPKGYHLLSQEITFTVSGGKVVTGPANNYTENTVTVYNSTGYELPESGGLGTTMYTIGGLLLITGAGSLLLADNKKHRK